MAPILKEADVPATTATTTAAPASPAAKSPNETPTRPQPVPLEIPVTVNGARTVEGSDKREPFSETTQTVLVFPHGAVIRIATPLAPGQLVFLTNEKSKKEVVCQVVKSKSGGSASGYVELQFTEPAPAFWGLRIPGIVALSPATAPAVPRPAAVIPPIAPKVAAPAPPPAAKISGPAPVAPPVAQIPAPAKPIVPPAAPVSVAKPEPTATFAVAPAPPISIAPPSAPKLPDVAPVQTISVNTTPSAPSLSVPPPPAQAAEPVSAPIPQAPKPLIPAPAGPPPDYSKEIESLFAVPQAPASAPSKPIAPPVPPAPPTPVSSSPSTEELKQQAARLQEQLSSMLFTEAPKAPPISSAPPAELKSEAPVANVVSKIFEIAHEEPRPVAHSEIKVERQPEIKPEPKPSAPLRTPVFSSLNAKDEEVEVPAWLRPLSQHAETFVEEPALSIESAAPSSNESVAQESIASAATDVSSRPETAVFGGQLLGVGTSSEQSGASGSKKGLFLGLAAAAALLAGGGVWYFRQNQPAVATPQPAQTVTTPSSAEPVAPAVPSPAPGTSTSFRNANTTPASPAPAPAASSPAPAENRNSTAAHNAAPAPTPEPPKKPALGEVRLATPVVKGSAGDNQSSSGEPLPAIDTPIQNSGTDALAAASHHEGPVAPIPIGGDVKPAQVIKSVPPVYPQMAKTQRITGNVTLDALIDTSGDVAELKVLSGPPLLHRAAVEAVKQWKYTPALLNGSPTTMHLTVTVQFRTQ